MVIRSKTLRFVILISTIIITLIIAIQLIWLQKVYAYEEKQFNINVSKSIRGLYDDMELVNDVSDNMQKIIENPKPDVYLFRIDCLPNLDSLWINLKSELTDFDVYTDSKMAVYDHQKNQFIHERYIDLPDSYHSPNNDNPLTVYKKEYSYILLFFPHRSQYILNQIFLWILSSAVLLIVLIAFGASIFYLYRQKFLNETQKDFVNNFTHEFKTPLAVIKIAAEVLQQPNIAENPERLKNYSGIINDQTSHLQSQIQRLLEIAYTDRISMPLEKDMVDINKLILQAIADMQPIIDQNGAVVKTIFGVDQRSVLADKSYLLLAFINLIENAIKYSEKPVIEIKTYQEGNAFFVAIKDNGPGISKEHHKKIFDRFYRITKGNLHTVKGFGLGLSFVKKVIDAHNGKISLINNIDKGSTFVVSIPIK